MTRSLEDFAKQLHLFADELTAIVVNHHINQHVPTAKQRLIEAIRHEVNKNKNKTLLDQLSDACWDLGVDRVADLSDEQVATVAAKFNLSIEKGASHGQNFDARI